MGGTKERIGEEVPCFHPSSTSPILLMSRLERKYCLISTSYLPGLFYISIFISDRIVCFDDFLPMRTLNTRNLDLIGVRFRTYLSNTVFSQSGYLSNGCLAFSPPRSAPQTRVGSVEDGTHPKAPFHTTLGNFENAVLFPQLRLPSTLIRHESRATLLGATCRVCLATVLRCVATCWMLLAQN